MNISQGENNNSSQLTKELRNVLQKDLPNVDQLSESIMLRSLMFTNFNVEKSAEFLKSYIKIRKNHQEYFIKSIDDKFKSNFSKLFTTIRHPGLNGECIIVFTVSEWDPCEVEITNLFAAFLFAFECLSLDDNINQNGIHLLGNAQGVGWKHVKACSMHPLLVPTFFNILSSSPVNLKLIISFNTNWAIDLIYKFVAPLLPKSIHDRIYLVGDPSKLVKHLGEDVSKSEKLKPSQEDQKAFWSLVDEKTSRVLEDWAVLDECF